jgi:hypothetical protein
MADDISTVVSRLLLEADDQASPVLQRLGGTADSTAAQVESAGGRIAAAYDGINRQIQSTLASLEYVAFAD